MTALVSAFKAAKLSGIPYRVLLTMIQEHEIPSVDLPHRANPMIDVADLSAFIQVRKSGTVLGTEGITRPAQDKQRMAPKQRSQRRVKAKVSGGNVHWSERFTKSGR